MPGDRELLRTRSCGSISPIERGRLVGISYRKSRSEQPRPEARLGPALWRTSLAQVLQMRGSFAATVVVLALAGACAAEEEPDPDSGPVEDSIPMVSTTTAPPETTAAPTTAAPTTAKPQPLVATTAAPPATTATTAAPATTAGVYYANCEEARAAGAAPIARGDPGYRSGLDRDGDGTACDK